MLETQPTSDAAGRDGSAAECRSYFCARPTGSRNHSASRARAALALLCGPGFDPSRLVAGDRVVRAGERCRIRRMAPAVIRALELPVAANRASADEWRTLPGVGPALARRIVAARRARGGFRQAGDLRAVRGIGPRLLLRIRSRLRFGSAPYTPGR